MALSNQIAAATKAAAVASQDNEVSGLGNSDAVLHLKSNYSSLKTQYNTGIDESSEKPLLLTYFTVQGLGEVPKLILAEAGMPYEFIGIIGSEDQSLAMEWRSRSPNGLLPILSGAGIPRSSPISQSGAIIRFLARRLGMDGGDVVASSRVDVLYETAKDFGASEFGGSDNRKAIASINPDHCVYQPGERLFCCQRALCHRQKDREDADGYVRSQE